MSDNSSASGSDSSVAPAHAVADLWWTTDLHFVVCAVGGDSLLRAKLTRPASGTRLVDWLQAGEGSELSQLLDATAAGTPASDTVEVMGLRCHVRMVPRAGEPGWHGALFVLRGAGDAASNTAELRQHQRLEVIGTLASGVAHEINNPIQSIMNYAQLIRNRSQSEQLGEYAKEILYEAQRVAGIVKNLLLFARQEGQPYAEAFMDELVQQTLSLTAAVLRREQVTVEVDVPTDLPAVVCHPQQIQQVIMNLVTNARDALNARYPEGDEDKRLRITARALPDAGGVRTTIEDRGGGMEADAAARLFDPEHLKLNHSSGLGLSVCHAIVQDHGGSLSIETQLGRCTRIHLDLPAAGE